MNVLVLGGCGSQGRAALCDLSRNVSVDRITCADIQPELADSFDFIDKSKIQSVRIDANDPNALASKMDEGFDVVLDFLPPGIMPNFFLSQGSLFIGKTISPSLDSILP